MSIPQQMRRFWPAAILCLLAVAALGRVALTYAVFNHTADEPTHILCGLEWLQRGTYTIEDLHPPLARVAAALGPYLDGLRLRAADVDDNAADELLYRDGKYYRYLTLARLGVLPFLLLLICVVAAWTARLFAETRALDGSDSAARGLALVAVLLLTTVPPVLAHAGLAATDLAATACVTLALFSWWLFLRAPTLFRALLFGLSFGLALLSKMSAWGFVPAGAVAIAASEWLVHRRGAHSRAPAVLPIARGARRPAPLALAAIVLLSAAGVVWSGYRWSLRPVAETQAPANVRLNDAADEPAVTRLMNTAWGRARVPGVEIVHGFREARQRIYDPDTRSYFLGRIGSQGFWLFFPVALAVKTPLPFLLLLIAGLVFAVREARRPAFPQDAPYTARRVLALAAAALLILLIGMSARLNIGLRHVLPVYPLLAIVAAYGVYRLWRLAPARSLARVAVVALLLSQAWISLAAHPGYLAYFNPFAGSDPSHVLIDSDIDWGQDLDRLGAELRARHVTHLNLAYFGSALPAYHDLPPYEEMGEDDRPGGWVAISVSMLRYNPGAYGWLQKEAPVERVGGSILLYHLPELKEADDDDEDEPATPPASSPKTGLRKKKPRSGDAENAEKQ